MTPVAAAREALYARFAPYAAAHLEGCPHCVSSDETLVLRRTPLRQLGAELDRYLFKAMTTCGTEEDFKHFVPRLLELHAGSSHAWLLRDKLAYARFPRWPAEERGAVEAFLRALWARALEGEHPPPGDPLLETLLALDLDIAPYDPTRQLATWRAEGSAASMACLSGFVLDHAELFWPSTPSRLPQVFRVRYELADAVCTFLLEPETQARLEAAFLTHGSADLARAFDLLELARR